MFIGLMQILIQSQFKLSYRACKNAKILILFIENKKNNDNINIQDSAYDAPEIKTFSKSFGHVPIIDPNKQRGEEAEFSPAEKIRFHERSTAERGNSELKDSYGARNIRVKGHGKVLCHLMFGILALTVKTLFNML